MDGVVLAENHQPPKDQSVAKEGDGHLPLIVEWKLPVDNDLQDSCSCGGGGGCN